MGWTSERKETLRRMWLEGVTSRKISEALGDVSRNAVMGMVNRMGLMGSGDHNRKLAGRLHGASNAEYRARKAQAAAALEAAQEVDPLPLQAVAAEIPSPDATPMDASAPIPIAPTVGAGLTESEVTAAPMEDMAAEIAVVSEVPEAVEAEPTVSEHETRIAAPVDAEPTVDAAEPVIAMEDPVVAIEAPVSAVAVPALEIEATVSAVTVPVVESEPPVMADEPASTSADAPEMTEAKPGAETASIEIAQDEAVPVKGVETTAPTRKPVAVAAVAKSATKPRPASNDSDLLMRKSRPFAGPLSRPSAPVAPKPAGMVAVRVATDGSRPNDWRTVVTLVEEVTGFAYDPKRKGHRAALVSIATLLSRGDPRRILIPFLSEPQVISMMRPLAEKGIIIGGKTPEAWLDPELGDTTFMIDMLVAEGVLDAKARKTQMAEAA